MKVLPPIMLNLGIERAYRLKLRRLIDEMHRSVRWLLTSTYRDFPPELALDELPAVTLQRATDRLKDRWLNRFDDLALSLASHFALDVSKRSDAVLRSILRKSGMSVAFHMTPAMRDVFQATVHQNVALIRSIPEQYLSQVEGFVQRSVQVGGDVGQLTRDLAHNYDITWKRAALIAKDQNVKATSAFNRVRALEVAGDEAEAIWHHSHAGKVPRPTHVKAGRERVKYRVAQGWFDPHEGRFIQPGELIHCRCSGRLIIKGFT